MRTTTILGTLLFLASCDPTATELVERYELHAEAIRTASIDLVIDVGQAGGMNAIDRAHARYERRLHRHADALDTVIARLDDCALPKDAEWTIDEASLCVNDLVVAQHGLALAHAQHWDPAQCAEAVTRHHKVVEASVRDLLMPCETWAEYADCDLPERTAPVAQ